MSHISVECLVGLPSFWGRRVFFNHWAPSNTGRIGEAVLLDLMVLDLAGNDSEFTSLRPPGDRMMWFLWVFVKPNCESSSSTNWGIVFKLVGG